MKTNIPLDKKFKTVGIDVSKMKLDVHFISSGTNKTIPNSPKEVEKLVSDIRLHKPNLVVLEGTGGYEALFISLALKKHLPVVRVNPKRVRDFAKALGLLAKTDKIDASVIAIFGNIKPFPPESLLQLEELVTRRHQLVEMRKMETTRKDTASDELKADLERHLCWLDEEVGRLDAQIRKELNNCPEFKDKVRILSSVKGVGPVLTATLLTRLPELGKLNKQEISALVGVAPYNHDSGQKSGTRSIYGGRKDVRSALYMATLSACRFNPTIRKFYEHLKEQGKAEKVAITACMRKLIVILNTMIKTGRAWGEFA
jgi:transposase